MSPDAFLLVLVAVGILLAADLYWRHRARRRLARRIRREQPTMNTRGRAP